MSPAFVSLAVPRSLRAHAYSALRCSAFTPRLATTTTTTNLNHQRQFQLQSLRMQCTPTGQVPEMNNTVVGNMERKIKDSLNPTKLTIIPALGDPNGAHVQIEVVSDSFEGMNSVKRHQAVYKAIWEELNGPVHAVDKLVTKTPSEDSSA